MLEAVRSPKGVVIMRSKTARALYTYKYSVIEIWLVTRESTGLTGCPNRSAKVWAGQDITEWVKVLSAQRSAFIDNVTAN